MVSKTFLGAVGVVVAGISLAVEAGAQDQAPPSIVSPLGHPMTLKFHDEFNAMTDANGRPTVDPAKWKTTFWQGSSERTLPGNQEAELYMDADFVGRGEIPASQSIDPKFTFKYGYVEGRFKLPANRGAWPALWLLEDDPSLGDAGKAHRWPPEIDIFEFMGHWLNKHDGAIIARNKDPGEKVNDWTLKYHTLDYDLSKDFHTWGVEWNENDIAFTFDGQIWQRGKTPPSMQAPMYLLINLAVGGRWYAGEITNLTKTPTKAWEVDEASMPWKLQCDYVRVYQ
jgi:beta-glucanase (GH16 family)